MRSNPLPEGSDTFAMSPRSGRRKTGRSSFVSEWADLIGGRSSRSRVVSEPPLLPSKHLTDAI
jgi:hypothetical protein